MSEAESVVVVGGSSGIGEAVAAAFVARGAEVLIVGRDAAKLDAARKRLAKVNAKVADARDPVQMKEVFGTKGTFDHLILSISAGKGGGPFRLLAMDDLRSGLEGKLLAYLSTLQAALPFLTQSVTFVSAASARAALPGTVGLAAINGAIESLVRPLAVELAPLRVNAVSPGVIDTPWWDAVPADMKQGMFDKAAKTLPAGRVGGPQDVASAIAWVATDGFVTGTVVDVSGGAALAR